MKSSLVTENGRRTKTTPDQSSLISYSSRKSCLSSERKTQVKATCKVLCEMREDQSSNLAVKFTQLQIVLATQSIIQVISKFRSAKLQTYFWILLQDRRIIHPSAQNHSIESIPLPQVVDDWSYLQFQHKTKLKQRHHNQSSSPWILMKVLNKIKQKQQRSFFQLINQNAKICQGTLLLRKFIKNIIIYKNAALFFASYNLHRIIKILIHQIVVSKIPIPCNYNNNNKKIAILKRYQLRNNWLLNLQVQQFWHQCQTQNTLIQIFISFQISQDANKTNPNSLEMQIYIKGLKQVKLIMINHLYKKTNKLQQLKICIRSCLSNYKIISKQSKFFI